MNGSNSLFKYLKNLNIKNFKIKIKIDKIIEL